MVDQATVKISRNHELGLNRPLNGCYSIADNHVQGTLHLGKGKQGFFSRSKNAKVGYGFRGYMNVNRNGEYDNVLFFDYPLTGTAMTDISIDFEFPCHNMYLPSTFQFSDTRIRLSIAIKYEIYAEDKTWEIAYQGKNLDNMEMDSELIWNEFDNLGSGKIGVKRYFNLNAPISTQIQFIIEKFQVEQLHFSINCDIIVNINRRKSLSYGKMNIGVVNWNENNISKSLSELLKNQSVWCDGTILDLLETTSQILIGVKFVNIDNIIWVPTGSIFDFLIEERLPPNYDSKEQASIDHRLPDYNSEHVADQQQPPSYQMLI